MSEIREKAKTLGDWIKLREKIWINSDLTREQVYEQENSKILVLVEVAEAENKKFKADLKEVLDYCDAEGDKVKKLEKQITEIRDLIVSKIEPCDHQVEHPNCFVIHLFREERDRLASLVEVSSQEKSSEGQKQSGEGNYGLELAIGEKIKEQKQKKEAEK